MNIINWHALEPQAVVKKLDTDSVKGLDSLEVKRRLKQYGFNTLEQNGRPKWYTVFLRQFVDVLVIILLIATLIAFLLGEMQDAIAIFAIIVLNSVLGFTQEWKAEKAMDALRSMLSLRCTVVRDNIEQEIDAKQLVPGDIVLLEIGDQVPADLRLLETVNLKIDESVLTGESYAVSKTSEKIPEDTILALRTPMAFMSTSVTNGHASGVVVATNMATEFGRIAHLTKVVKKEVTPLQRKLAVLGKQLGIFSIAISAAIALMGFLLGKSVMTMFFTGISLAVAVVPEGLPAVVTITMALGIHAMAKRRALLRRLRSAETLGASTVICTDKTGTLTQNEMTVTRIWLPTGIIKTTGVGYDTAGHFEIDDQKIDYRAHSDLTALLKTGMICNHAKLIKDKKRWHPLGEPTEAALMVAAYKAWLSPEDKPPIISEFSFNSSRKRMTVIVHQEESMVAHVKGAPEVILGRCTHIREGDHIRPLTETDSANFTQAYLEMGKDGLRTLALAERKLPKNLSLEEDTVEQDLTLLGMVGMIDPPRPEVPQAIRVAHAAGIRTIMITGDAALTASTIAERIGIHAVRVITGVELDQMDDEALRSALNQQVIFARVTPEHKLRIVTLLQQMGEVVGMTGDGVNDAPALKKSDIGIAMGIRGTDVAREASDMVLTDDNFASIVNAVEEGRHQYANIKKFIRFLLSSNTGEVIAIFLSILSNSPLILLPVQILWMNLVTDGVIAMALGVEPVDKDIMTQKPQSPKAPIMGKSHVIVTLLLGGYIGLMTFWFFYHYLKSNIPHDQLVAQTVAFTGIIVLEKINVFNFRSFNRPLAKIGFFSNPWLLWAWLSSIGLQVCAVYIPFLQKMLHTVPLRLSDWGFIFLLSLPILIIPEFYKLVTHAKQTSSFRA
jgi:Ca2+-transporting ATPase